MGLKREKTPGTETETDTETVDRSLQEVRSLQLSVLKKSRLFFIQESNGTVAPFHSVTRHDILKRCNFLVRQQKYIH